MLPFSEDNNDLLVLKQQAVSTKSSCDIIFMKIKVIWFYIQKTIFLKLWITSFWTEILHLNFNEIVEIMMW